MKNEGRRKKVLFFTPGTVGGAERVTLTIAKMLPLDKYDVKIVFVSKNGVDDLAQFVPKEFPIKKIFFKKIWMFTIWRMLGLIKRENPDIIFSSIGFLNWRLCVLSKFCKGIKLIIRSDNMPQAFPKLDSFFIKRFYHCANTVIFQTKEMMEAFKPFLQGIDKNKLKVVTNPIDVKTIEEKVSNSVNPYDGKHKEIVFVGRVTKVKGLDFLLPVFKEIANDIPEVRLTIVGKVSETNSYYKDMLTLAKALEIEDKVDFVGFQNNPYKWIKYADCFVLPSRIEGLPNVVREAVYLNTPVVATRSVPVVDRLIPSGRGFVIDVDDHKALKECILKCLNMHIKNPYEYKPEGFLKLFEN